MSCTPTPCPPGAPDPNTPFSLGVPTPVRFAGQAPAGSEFQMPAPPGNHCLPEGVCNQEQQYTATCPDGAITTPVTITVPPCSFYATTQDEANAIALARAQFLAEAALHCEWVNDQQEYTASCPDGSVTLPVTVVVMAGTIHSTISKADANAQALALATSEAIAALPQCVYSNHEQCCTYTPYFGDPVTVTVFAGTYSGTNQALIDHIALDAACKAARSKEIPVIVDSVTYQGNLKWYGYFPYDYTGVDVSEIPERYLDRTAGGNNILIYGGSYEFPDPLHPAGTINTYFTGSTHISPVDGTETGAINKRSEIRGRICNGLSFLYADNTVPIVLTGSAPSLAAAFPGRTGGEVLTFHTQQVFFATENRGPGYLQSYCGAGVNSRISSATEDLSNRMSIEQAAAAGGASIITSTNYSDTVSYNSGTGVSNGISTTLHFTSPQASLSGRFLIYVTYTKHPNVSGPDVPLVHQFYVDVGVGNFLNLYEQIPMFAGYRVTFNTINIYDFFEVGDDFSQLVPETGIYGTLGYVLGNSWPNLPIFGMPQPGSEAGTDWDPNQLIGNFTTDPTGWYWKSTAVFSSLDYTTAQEDFESYPVGDLTDIGQGIGWKSPGYFLTTDYTVLGDDFESYSTGTITALNFNTGVFDLSGGWVADGTFGIVDYLIVTDDYESYSPGTITTLTGGTNWFAAGSFAIF